MDKSAAIRLISPGVNRYDLRWADLGCGAGTFTIALASLLSRESTIFAVDNDEKGLRTLSNSHSEIIKTIHADFTDISLTLPQLNGILMANSLHFVADKDSLMQSLSALLLPEGRILIVEYDTEASNPWVPYPISFDSLRRLVSRLGMSAMKTGTHPSIYGTREMYAAVITKSL